MKIEIEVPDLPPEAAGYEVVNEVRHAMPNEWYFRREIHNDDPGRWIFHDGSTPTSGSYIVARKPKPRGLAFIESLPPGTAFVHEGELYARGPNALRTVTTEHILLIAEKRFYSSGQRSWRWDNDKESIDFDADNCRVIWPENKEQCQS